MILPSASRLPAVGLLLIACFALNLRAGDLARGLTPSQMKKIKEGSQVIEVEDVGDLPWPRVTIYQKVNAKPEEVAAVFFDFEDSKRFIPNVLKAEISRNISPMVLEVDYAINIPILPDEYYTVRNTLSQPAPKCYGISWKLLKAVQTKDSVGSFHTEPFEDGALMRYQNLVTPGSSMAGLLRGLAIGQMENAASAIADRAESLKKSNPEELQPKVRRMQSALGQ